MVDVVGQLQRLHELVAQATEATTVQGIAQVLVEEGAAVLGARTGALWTLAGDHLELVHFRGAQPPDRYVRIPIAGDTPLAACVNERTPIWLADAEEYERRFPVSIARTGLRVGCVCLPLVVGDRAIGGAVFAFEGARRFTDPEKVSLALIARQCAQALDRLSLVEAERAARREAEQLAQRMTALQAAAARLAAARGPDELQRVVIDESIAMIGASAAALWMRSGGEATMVAQLGGSRVSVEATARIRLDDRGLLGVALRHGKPVWMPSRGAAAAQGFPIVDARWDGIEALAFVPLVAGGHVLGALGMSFAERRSFEVSQRELIELFANHAAQAILREREDATRNILGAVTRAIATSLDPQTVLERLAELSVGRFADWCVVDVERENSLVRVVVAHASPEDAALAGRLRRYHPSSLHGNRRAIETQQPALLATITDEILQQVALDSEHLQVLRDLGGRSLVSSPMMIGGRAVGSITWVSRTRTFDERDVELSGHLAGGAAAAIENARLYAAEAAAAMRLGKLYELSAALSSSRTPLEVAQATAQHATEALGASATMIWTRSTDGRLRLVGADAPPEWCAKWAVLPEDPEFPANRVLATGEPLIVETPQEYEVRAALVYESAREAGRVNAFIAVALSVGGVRAGVLTLGFKGEHRFTRDEREFVTSIAQSCEHALDRAQLYVNEARARSEAEAASHAKDRFVAIAGHALRNRLAPVVSALEVMRLTGLGGGTEEREIIERQVRELTVLVDDLVVIARGTSRLPGSLDERCRLVAPAVHGVGPCARSLRVLVVEDNRDAATVLGALLRILGHEPMIAHDGPGALACAERDRPQLALLDLGLPGMDGYELVRRLRERPDFEGVPIVALTGYDQASDRDRTREAGFVEHLVKPVDLQRLHEVVGRFA